MRRDEEGTQRFDAPVTEAVFRVILSEKGLIPRRLVGGWVCFGFWLIYPQD